MHKDFDWSLDKETKVCMRPQVTVYLNKFNDTLKIPTFSDGQQNNLAALENSTDILKKTLKGDSVCV